jgi:ribosomal protein S21
MLDPKENKKPIILPENTQIDYQFDKMLKFFIKSVEKSGILQEVKERRYYSKPSEIKHKIESTLKRKKVLQRRRRRKK